MSWKDQLKDGYAAFDVPLFKLGATEVTVATLITAALIVLVAFWMYWLLRKTFRGRSPVVESLQGLKRAV